MKRIWSLIAFAFLFLSACSKDDDRTLDSDSYDDLSYFMGSIVKYDSSEEFQHFLYGKILYPNDPEHLYISVANLTQAKEIFLNWIAPDVKVSQEGDALTCPLTAKDGTPQLTVCFTPGRGVDIAEVTFSGNAPLKYFSKLTFLLDSAWPYNSDDTGMACNITVNHPDGEWNAGDMLYVFFEDIAGARYLQLEYDGDVWSGSLKGGLLKTNLSDKGQMYAVHFPFEQPVITSAGKGVSFRRDARDQVHGQFIYSYYYTASGNYSIQDGKDGPILSGTLDMEYPDGFVQFNLSRSGARYNADFTYRLSLAGVTPVACASYSNGKFGTRTLAASQPLWGYRNGDAGVVFSGVIDDTWSDVDNEHRLYFFDTTAPGKFATIEEKTLASHDVMRFNASTVSSWYQAPTPSTISYEGTDWGTFNIGTNFNSSSEEKSGGWYFMWGDLVPARSMYPSGLPSPQFASSDYYLKTACYEAREGKTPDLTGEYVIFDAARAFLGPDWRLPTKEEFEVIARNFQDSPSSLWWKEMLNALFLVDARDEEYGLQLPGAGFWRNGSLNRGVPQDQNEGHYAGFYWFSTLERENDAFHFYFNHWIGPWVDVTHEVGSSCGLPIRPVKVKK